MQKQCYATTITVNSYDLSLSIYERVHHTETKSLPRATLIIRANKQANKWCSTQKVMVDMKNMHVNVCKDIVHKTEMEIKTHQR